MLHILLYPFVPISFQYKINRIYINPYGDTINIVQKYENGIFSKIALVFPIKLNMEMKTHFPEHMAYNINAKKCIAVI